MDTLNAPGIEVWSSISPMAANLSSMRHARSGFDGNRTDIILHWFFPTPEVEADMSGVVDHLMSITAEGHLRWALFLTPPVDLGEDL